MSLNVVEKTYEDLCRQILCYQKCALIRPTGFGKTHLIARICKDKKSLIVVPSTSLISDIKRRYGDKIKIITYTKLLSMHKRIINFFQEFGPLDYICLDEMHRAGAEKWYLAVEALLKEYPNINLIGASATPVRCDGKDITEMLFDNHQVFPYTIIDAMKDNLLPKPIYVRALYDFEEGSKEYLSLITSGYVKAKDKINVLETKIKKKRIKFEQYLNIPNIIKFNIPQETVKKNMKYIVFCSAVEEIQTSQLLAKEWFLQAFPEKTVNVYSLHSHNTKLQNATNMTLFIEDKEDSNIDLLFVVNMLNEGVHIKSVSGLLFFRKTKSHIVYTQQLGRCMEQGIKSPIVFDFVGNIEHITDIKESFGSAMGIASKTTSIEYFDQYVYLKDYVIDIEKELNALVNEMSFKSKFLTEEEKQQILEMFHNQLSCEEIAAQVDRHPTCIARFLKRHNLFFTQKDILEDEVIFDYQQGMSILELAKKFHYDKNKIRLILNNNGIETNKIITKEEEDYICQLYKEGKTSLEIQEITNRCKSSVNKILREENLRNEKGFNKEKIRQMYESGSPLYQICKVLKIHQTRVAEYLEEIGLRESYKIYKITDDKITQILNLYQDGASLSKISKETKIGPERIKSLLIEKHVYQEPKINKADPEILKEILKEYKNGISCYALSKKYPYSKPTIYKYIKEHNILQNEKRV